MPIIIAELGGAEKAGPEDLCPVITPTSPQFQTDETQARLRM